MYPALDVYSPLIDAIVAASIVAPTIWYFASRSLQAFVASVEHLKIMLMHTWRIPAALYLAFKTQSVERYWRFHRFGFLDFVVAVGTGLTYTLLLDPRMVPITVLPIALIPLFGVGISGATHLMAFDMLRRKVGLHNQPTT